MTTTVMSRDDVSPGTPIGARERRGKEGKKGEKKNRNPYCALLGGPLKRWTVGWLDSSPRSVPTVAKSPNYRAPTFTFHLGERAQITGEASRKRVK